MMNKNKRAYIHELRSLAMTKNDIVDHLSWASLPVVTRRGMLLDMLMDDVAEIREAIDELEDIYV